MSYLTQNLIAENRNMNVRVAQCHAQQIPTAAGGTDPDRWAYENHRDWAASPGWDLSWESALVSHPPVEGEPPYDPGADEGVITDGMILTQVQLMLGIITPEEAARQREEHEAARARARQVT